VQLTPTVKQVAYFKENLPKITIWFWYHLMQWAYKLTMQQHR